MDFTYLLYVFSSLSNSFLVLFTMHSKNPPCHGDHGRFICHEIQTQVCSLNYYRSPFLQIKGTSRKRSFNFLKNSKVCSTVLAPPEKSSNYFSQHLCE